MDHFSVDISAAGGLLGERESEGNSGGGGGGGGGGGEGNSASAAGNRWPQEETSALLNIRLEMDLAFRDAGGKAPLWDEVSRRLSQLGYNRSAAKCKEKFENLYKYHKRTKHSRLVRSNGKTYKFFDQLEALDHQQFSPPCPSTEKANATNTFRTMTTTPVFHAPAIQSPMPNSLHNSASYLDVSTSSSSGDEYDEGSRKRKRKWQEFFGRVMKIVLEKQEDLHKKFLEALDRCEGERIAREDAWKNHEMSRIKREQELLEQERLISATKDAAVIAFLQKVSEQGKSFADQGKSFVQVPENPSGEEKSMGDEDNGDINRLRDSFLQSGGGSRWPKEEVDALIKIRTDMEINGQGDAPKGLWEEISASMKKLGYERNPKRCKEKWENINKYYRRVKESNKKRPLDSKTCSYFQQLEALYHIKAQKADNASDNSLRPEELLMHMMNHHRGHEGRGNLDRIQDDDHYDDDDDDDDDDYEEAEDQIGATDTSTRSIMARDAATPRVSISSKMLI